MILRDNKGRNAIAQPALEIEYDLTGGDFVGTSTAQLYTSGTTPLLKYGKHPISIKQYYGKGFVFRPQTGGDYKVLTYEAFRANGGIDDTLATTMYELPAGVYVETRVIKVYATGSAGTLINIGV